MSPVTVQGCRTTVYGCHSLDDLRLLHDLDLSTSALLYEIQRDSDGRKTRLSLPRSFAGPGEPGRPQ